MRSAAVILTGLLLTSAAPVALAQPVLIFGTEGVSAKGITPGGSAVWFGVGHARGEWFDHVYHFQQVANDDDGDGKVEFKRETAIPDQSVLLVVDVASGEFAWGGPPPTPHHGPRPFPIERASYGPSGAIERLSEEASRLAVLVCRKGEGVWAGDFFDGGPFDTDKTVDTVVSINFATVAPVGNTVARLVGLLPGDVVVLIDTGTLRFSATRLVARAN